MVKICVEYPKKAEQSFRKYTFPGLISETMKFFRKGYEARNYCTEMYRLPRPLTSTHTFVCTVDEWKLRECHLFIP